MKQTYILTSLLFGLSASALGVGCQDSFKDCENSLSCPPAGDGDGDTATGGGDGDGDTGDGDGDGDTGGTGGVVGTGGGDGDGTGGMGGDPNDPCLSCEEDEYCTSEKECVECQLDEHCDGATPVCDPLTSTCVGCVDETDCEDPALPMCDGFACVSGCEGSGDCEQFVNAPVCDDVSGECVGCLTSDDCGGDVCARVTHTCVDGRVAGALSVCQSCEYDDDCQTGQLCVTQEFDGAVVGNYCTWRKDGRAATVGASCLDAGKPYAAPSLATTSVEGQIADLCVLRSTSCPAFVQHSQVVAGCADETPTSDAACGFADVDDGLCREPEGGGNTRCTYPCGSDEDCFGNFTCVGPVDEKYCSL